MSIDLSSLREPTVRAAMEAFQRGDAVAWRALLAPGAQLYDDGAPRDLDAFTREALGHERFTQVDHLSDDGLELRHAWVTSPVKCAPPANKPTPDERRACAPFLAEELALLDEARVIVALGKFGFDAVCDHLGLRPRPRFGHGVEVEVPPSPDRAAGAGRPLQLLGCYHVSQQNTFTGTLTEPMLDAVFARARALAGLPAMPGR